MKKVALSEIKDQLSKYLREAQRGDVLITLHGKPAGVLVGSTTSWKTTPGSLPESRGHEAASARDMECA